MSKSDTTPAYPAWICDGCGAALGRRIPTLCTVHVGECGICRATLPVTQPRDYGHLRQGWEGGTPDAVTSCVREHKRPATPQNSVTKTPHKTGLIPT